MSTESHHPKTRPSRLSHKTKRAIGSRNAVFCFHHEPLGRLVRQLDKFYVKLIGESSSSFHSTNNGIHFYAIPIARMEAMHNRDFTYLDIVRLLAAYDIRVELYYGTNGSIAWQGSGGGEKKASKMTLRSKHRENAKVFEELDKQLIANMRQAAYKLLKTWDGQDTRKLVVEIPGMFPRKHIMRVSEKQAIAIKNQSSDNTISYLWGKIKGLSVKINAIVDAYNNGDAYSLMTYGIDCLYPFEDETLIGEWIEQQTNDKVSALQADMKAFQNTLNRRLEKPDVIPQVYFPKQNTSIPVDTTHTLYDIEKPDDTPIVPAWEPKDGHATMGYNRVCPFPYVVDGDCI